MQKDICTDPKREKAYVCDALTSEEKKLQNVPEADEVVIKILQPHTIEKFMGLKWKSEGEIQQILRSIARRAKYEFLLWKVVAEGHVGTLPREVVWEGKRPSWDADYEVTGTKPKDDVQVTPKTKVICKLG